MAEAYLEVRNVSKSFRRGGVLRGRRGETRALDNVSFQVLRGQSVGIVGESGAGKSTLLKIALKLVKPTRGRILIDGEDVTGLRESAFRAFRRRIQPVFQDPYSTFNPRYAVGASIRLGLDIHEIGAGRAERTGIVLETLEKVGLSAEHAERLPHQLSGGQRQRAAIARALVIGPELIVADEPTSALDVSVQAQILNLLKDMRAELGLSYVFVSHNLAVVRFICDFIVVMRNGRIVETGDNEALFANPTEPYTRELIAAVPEVPWNVGS